MLSMAFSIRAYGLNSLGVAANNLFLSINVLGGRQAATGFRFLQQQLSLFV